MIDIKILRSNPELVRDSITKRNLKVDLDAFLALDSERLSLRKEMEELQAIRNRVSKEIPTISDASEKQAKIAEMKSVGDQIATMEARLAETEEEYDSMLYSIPNFLDPTTAV